MADYFAKDSVVRQVNNEPAVALLAGRALVLQLAHPAVSQAVADHSDFQRRPFGRLLGTLGSMSSMVNGSEELAITVGRRLHRLHEAVVGVNYQANAVENLLWVHATLVDSALLGYTTFVGPLEDSGREAFYTGMKLVAEPLGLPASDQPATFPDFRCYFDETVRSIEVTDAGRNLIGSVVDPVLPWGLHVPLAPVLALHRLITIGTTPASLRDQVRFDWDQFHQELLEGWVALLRLLVKAQPRSVRTLPARLGGLVLTRTRPEASRIDITAGRG